MKAILMPTQPKWCELIASGKKTVEVRKNKPTVETPFKCYIYCTAGTTLYVIGGRSTGKRIRPQSIIGNRKVIGEFVCDKIYEIYTYRESSLSICIADSNEVGENGVDIESLTCLPKEEIIDYLIDSPKCFGYGWHISDLKIYDKPKELSEFRKPCDRFLDGFLCRRYIRDEFGGCDSKIHRAPQSWCYVEEL